MQNVKVLAVGQEVEANDQARMHANPATVATLLVSPQDSERLALASAEGRLLLTLRSWTDSLPVNTAGAVAEELVGDPTAANGPVKPAETAGPHPTAPVATRRGRGKQVAAAQPPAVLPSEQPKRDVVEILRGDRFEQRNFSKGDSR